MADLQVLESPREQASDEVIAWTFDWSRRLDGQTISSAIALVTQLITGEDESAICVQGSPVVNGDQVQVVLKQLTARKRYRLTVRANLSGGTQQDADLFLDVPH